MNTTSCKLHRRIFLTACLALLALTENVLGLTHTWTGAGITGNWSLPANWQGNTPPTAAEVAPVILNFPAAAARLHNTNNIAGLTVHGMTFSGTGYVIEGSSPGITFSTAVLTFYNFNAANTTLGSTLKITLVGTPIFNVSGGVSVASHLTGSGGFVKSGSGEFVLSGTQGNDFTGATTVNGGTLTLSRGTPFLSSWLPAVSVSGPLNIGTTNIAVAASVVLMHGEQIADISPVTLHESGTLYLGGNNQTVGALTLIGGSVHGDGPTTTALGTLTLGANVSAPVSPISFGAILANVALGGGVVRTLDVQADHFNIHGVVSDGGFASGFVKTGPGELGLWNPTNTYRGLTTISEGSVIAFGNFSLGSTNNGTILHGGTQLIVQNSDIAEAFTIQPGGSHALIHCTASATLSSPIHLNGSLDINVDDFSQLTVGGAISGGGGIDKLGAGTLLFNGFDANTYTGTTSVRGLLKLSKALGLVPVQSIAGPLVIGLPGTLAIDAHSVRLQVSHQIADDSSITILDGGLLDLNGRSEKLGTIDIRANLRTGTGVLTLNGDIAADTGTGTPTIEGKLDLGFQQRHIHVDAGGTLNILAKITDGPGAAWLIKDGGGSLGLYGANTFDRTLAIFEGQVWGYHSNALGSAVSPTLVSAGAQLNLSNQYGHIVSEEHIVLNGNGQSKPGSKAGALWTYGGISLHGPMELQSDSSLFVTGTGTNLGYLSIYAPITGPGGLIKNGTGQLFFSGPEDNTHGGGTTVNAGELVLTKLNGAVAIPSPLVVNNSLVSWWENNQVDNGVNVTVRGTNGVLAVWDAVDRIGSLVMDSGSVHVDLGLLTLGGNVTVTGTQDFPSSVEGSLSLGGASRVFNISTNAYLNLNGSVQEGSSPAGFTVTGGGNVELNASNSFSGLVIADNGIVSLGNSHSLGQTTSGIIVTNHGSLLLAGVDIKDEALVISGYGGEFIRALRVLSTNSWSGPILLAEDMGMDLIYPSSTLTLSGPVSGAGGLDIIGDGLLRFTGKDANTFTGLLNSNLRLIELRKTNALAIHGPVTIASGMVKTFASNLIIDTAEIYVGDTGTFDLNGFSETIAGLTGEGIVQLGQGVLRAGSASPLGSFDGVISGVSGEFHKIGPNALTLRGDNTYSGSTFVEGGKLVIHGTQPLSDVRVFSGATLEGSGTLGKLFGKGGTISPGSGAGRLNVIGNSVFDPGTKLVMELNGTSPALSYDQLTVIGDLAANLSTLQVVMGFNGAISNRYILVNHPIGKTATPFAGLPEGAIVTATNGVTFRISYLGGDGNDTELTQLTVPSVAAPAHIGGITALGAGSVQISATGTPGGVYHVEANIDLNTKFWVDLGPVTANNAGALTFKDSQTANFPRRFYRFVAQ